MKYVLYHANCYDGFGAAFSAWKALGDQGVKYIPVSYGEPLPDLKDAEQIFILDFSYHYQILEGIAEHIPLVLIDHHKTAKEMLSDWRHHNATVIFDMEKSGALLTWNYFHASLAPMLIEHISDRDLWKFKLPGTAQIHKALVSYPMDFKVWDNLDVETLKNEGITCERLYTILVDNICDGSYFIELDGHEIPVVNTTIAWSEIGQELLKRYPHCSFAASYTVFEKQIMWSLRSKDEFDVGAIAKKFGGGGHKNAAGFKTVRI
jgi:oligoribonuclease NrnB/cAMP/cGMP phosphodiesterase (DHH superfamily)